MFGVGVLRRSYKERRKAGEEGGQAKDSKPGNWVRVVAWHRVSAGSQASLFRCSSVPAFLGFLWTLPLLSGAKDSACGLLDGFFALLRRFAGNSAVA